MSAKMTHDNTENPVVKRLVQGLMAVVAGIPTFFMAVGLWEYWFPGWLQNPASTHELVLQWSYIGLLGIVICGFFIICIAILWILAQPLIEVNTE